MARVTGSHLICKALKLEGVKNIFALAGDHILPVLDTMADQDFRIIVGPHQGLEHRGRGQGVCGGAEHEGR